MVLFSFTVEIDDDREDSVENLYDQTTHEPIYVNVNNRKLTNPIKVEELRDFIQKAKEAEHNTIELEHAVCVLWKSNIELTFHVLVGIELLLSVLWICLRWCEGDRNNTDWLFGYYIFSFHIVQTTIHFNITQSTDTAQVLIMHPTYSLYLIIHWTGSPYLSMHLTGSNVKFKICIWLVLMIVCHWLDLPLWFWIELSLLQITWLPCRLVLNWLLYL